MPTKNTILIIKSAQRCRVQQKLFLQKKARVISINTFLFTKVTCGENTQYLCVLFTSNIFQDTTVRSVLKTVKILKCFSRHCAFPFKPMFSSYRNHSDNLHLKSLDGFWMMVTIYKPGMV